ncbi:hypothetical protein RMCBS344292_04618 [Rhizopus microsporus]|nr:hypothetical protein RMCBS344292_04618 [Rhizopus microsporus]
MATKCPVVIHQFFQHFSALQLRNYSSHSVASLRRAVSKGNLKQARSAYESLDANVDHHLLRKLVLLVRNGKSRQDLDFLKTIIQDMPVRFNVTPVQFEYNALIQAYGIHHSPDKAHQLFNHMKSMGINPNVYSYNILLKCYKKNNDFTQAELLLKEMENNQLQPDTVTYNTLLQLWLQCRRYDKIFEFYKANNKNQLIRPDVYTLSIVLEAAMQSKHTVIGDQVFQQLFKREDLDTAAMNVMLRYKVDSLDDMLTLYNDLQNRCRADRITFNILLDASLKQGNPSETMMILSQMKRANIDPDIVTYGTWMNHYFRTGDLKSALDLLDEMLRADIKPTPRVLNSLVNTASSKMASLDHLDRLIDLIRPFEDKLDVKAYNSLMGGLARHGRSAQVQGIYDKVFRDNNLQPDIATFTHLILAYINDDLLEDAMEIYYALREHHKKCRDNPKRKAKVFVQLDATFYSILISSLSSFKENEKRVSQRLVAALKLFNDMRPLQIQPSTHIYTAMLHACGQNRDEYVLEHVYQLIKVDLYLDPDIGIYNALMDAYNRIGDGRTVLDIWQQLVSSAPPNVAVDQASVSIVLDSCGHNGYMHRAPSIWNWLKRTGFELNTNNYNSYIECLCRIPGRVGWDRALRLMKEDMRVPGDEISDKPLIEEKTFNTLISFAKKKQFEESEIKQLEAWKEQCIK